MKNETTKRRRPNAVHPYRPSASSGILGPPCTKCGKSPGFELHAPLFGRAYEFSEDGETVVGPKAKGEKP